MAHLTPCLLIHLIWQRPSSCTWYSDKYSDIVCDVTNRFSFSAARYYDDNCRYLRELVPSLNALSLDKSGALDESYHHALSIPGTTSGRGSRWRRRAALLFSSWNNHLNLLHTHSLLSSFLCHWGCIPIQAHLPSMISKTPSLYVQILGGPHALPCLPASLIAPLYFAQWLLAILVHTYSSNIRLSSLGGPGVSFLRVTGALMTPSSLSSITYPYVT